MTSSLRALLSGLFDYAGLFPPAALDMKEAVRKFAVHGCGPRAWMLGRFIVPAARIDEFERELPGALATSPRAEPWRVSVLAAPPFDDTVTRIWDFNGTRGACGSREAVIDSVEVKASTAAELEDAAQAIPAGFELFVETPTVNALPGLLAAVRSCGGTAKFRTGGTSAQEIPSVPGLAASMAACHGLGLSFKVTAGLHHPVRSDRPLTYDRDAPRADLHGFLNVLVAAAVMSVGWVDAAGAAGILAEESPDAFRVAEESIAWRGHRLTLADLRLARRFFRTIGTCSFDEPVAGLEVLGLL
jgi:hypothetical protein